MTPQEFLGAVRGLRVWQQGGQRAPHKPLLLLYALGRFQAGQTALPFPQVFEGLRILLRDFGPPNPTTPIYPYTYLERTLWHNGVPDELKPRRGEPRKTDLMRHNVVASLAPEVIDLLHSQPDLVGATAHELVDAHFPDSIQEDVLRAVGLNVIAPDWVLARRRRRDPAFRENVLAAYEYRCAVCDFDIAIGRDVIGLEGAHIRWVQADGPPEISNGLALCVLHHKLFDLGAWGIAPDRRILISDRVHGRSKAADDLLGLHGEPLRGPVRAEDCPAETHIRWHEREVFRGRPRQPRAA
ncbi:hypothetical protein CKO28_08945 [Rhodovibrio sodomensis]|uniref:Restriction endonuclease n=1 Tax=Rhodovibrio sodomensis TaxID=1088 RepID=A0ABS1DDG3_9PROT|nr:HNH endonuclease [Rhodovibrio sodomensis]MBK1668162.1 hypothetical protein [Rhodovibrio sodomensis]